jgi:quercetin dioxygenase-like cupin family protein
MLIFEHINPKTGRMNKMKWMICTLCLLACMAINGQAQIANENKKEDNQMKKTRSETFLYENQIRWEPAGEGVVRQVMGYDGQVMLVKVKFEKGAVGTPHTHYHTQTTYVASGTFEFTVGGEKKIVSTGDGIYIEPDVLHGCVCLEAGVLIDCFSPMRTDFLK